MDQKLEWKRVPFLSMDVTVVPKDWDGDWLTEIEIEEEDKVMVMMQAKDIQLLEGMCVAIDPIGRYLVFPTREDFDDYLEP